MANKLDVEIDELVDMASCHSHGYMCENCPMPDDPETFKAKLTALLTKAEARGELRGRISEVERFYESEKAKGIYKWFLDKDTKEAFTTKTRLASLTNTELEDE